MSRLKSLGVLIPVVLVGLGVALVTLSFYHPGPSAVAKRPSLPTPTSNATVSEPPTPEPTPELTGPVKLTVPKLGLSASIEQVGLTGGNIGIPSNSKNVAWFTGSVKPGEAGVSIVDGHKDWYDTNCAVFCHLDSLQAGDEIQVQTESGQILRFVVDKHEPYPNGPIPDWMKARSGPPQITLITCEGFYNPITGYSQRLVVTAHLT